MTSELYVVARIDSNNWLTERPTVGDSILGVIAWRVDGASQSFEIAEGRSVSESALRTWLDREAGATGVIIDKSCAGNFDNCEFTKVDGKFIAESWKQ